MADLFVGAVPWQNGSIAKAPHLQQLYNEGIGVPNAYVQRWCTPTRAALMTGRYPYRNGWNVFGGDGCLKQCGNSCCPGYQAYPEELSSVPLSFEMMPAMLKRGGYTPHMLGKVGACGLGSPRFPNPES